MFSTQASNFLYRALNSTSANQHYNRTTLTNLPRVKKRRATRATRNVSSFVTKSNMVRPHGHRVNTKGNIRNAGGVTLSTKRLRRANREITSRTRRITRYRDNDNNTLLQHTTLRITRNNNNRNTNNSRLDLATSLNANRDNPNNSSLPRTYNRVRNVASNFFVNLTYANGKGRRHQ